MLDTITKPQQRITVWRNYKKQDLDKNKIIKYISGIKTVERTFDFYTPKDWPTSWEILEHSMFCYSGKALLLHDTLVHKEMIKPNNVNWLVVDNLELEQVGLAFFDDMCYYNILPDQTLKQQKLDNYIRILEKIKPSKLSKIRA